MLAGNGGRQSARRRSGTWGQTAPCFHCPGPLAEKTAGSGHLWHCSKTGAAPSNRKAAPFFAACFQISPKYIFRLRLLPKFSQFRIFSPVFSTFKSIVSISPPFVQHLFYPQRTESSGSILYNIHKTYSFFSNLPVNWKWFRFLFYSGFLPKSIRMIRLFHPCSDLSPPFILHSFPDVSSRFFPGFSFNFPSSCPSRPRPLRGPIFIVLPSSVRFVPKADPAL